MNLARLIDDAAMIAGDRVAIYLGCEASLNFLTLAERVARLAGHLIAAGINPGDRVALFMANHVSYVEVLYGVLRAGAVAVPINAKLHEAELAFILEESGAAFCFVNAASESTAQRAVAAIHSRCRLVNVDLAEYRRALRAEPSCLVSRDGDDLAWLFFTSGTTGCPKGAMLTHRNLFLMTASYLTEVHAVTSNHILLHAAPMSHGSGMYNFAHVASAAAQIVPESAHFEPAEVLRILSVLDGVSLFAAPTMVSRLVREIQSRRDDARGLDLIVYGGGPMLVDQIRTAIAQLGPRFAQIYGQGECPMTITRLRRQFHLDSDDESSLRRLSSVGTPFNLVDVRIGDCDHPFLPGEAGEILVRSPIVMKGYWTRKAGAGASAPEWLPTGDVGYFDTEGFLHLTDRSKDVIISGGSNIYSREVEDVLAEHPGVLEVAVVGHMNPEWGEEVVAVIGHGEHVAPEVTQLDQLCMSKIARFKRPRRYVFLQDLPKNAYGKIEKRALREYVMKLFSSEAN